MLGGVQIYADYGRQKSKEVPEASVLLEGESEWKQGGGGFEILGGFHNYKAEVSRVLMWLSVTGYVVVGGEKLSGGG